MNQITEMIFEKLDQNITFPEEVVKVYNLIKQYSDRVKFVKDHAGLKDVLFLSTLETDTLFFDVPYFCVYDFNPEKYHINQQIDLIYNSEEIYKETKTFLETTERTLYVGVGFKECYVTNMDHMKILHILEDTKCSVNDAYVTVRRFPEWYLGDYPGHIVEAEKYLNLLHHYEKINLEKAKENILKKLNLAVEQNNKKEFEKLAKEYSLIENQIEEE